MDVLWLMLCCSPRLLAIIIGTAAGILFIAGVIRCGQILDDVPDLSQMGDWYIESSPESFSMPPPPPPLALPLPPIVGDGEYGQPVVP